MNTGIQFHIQKILYLENISHMVLPFTLDLPNKSAIWDRINRILSESLDRDVMSYNRFDNETVTAIPRLLFLLASSVEISITKLTGTLELNKKTVMVVLAALEKQKLLQPYLQKEHIVVGSENQTSICSLLLQ